MTNNDGDELTTVYDDEVPDMHAYRSPPEGPEIAKEAEADEIGGHQTEGDEDGDEADSRPSIATQLVAMARENYLFGVDENGETFARDTEVPHLTLSMSNSSRRGLKGRLLDQWWVTNERVAPGGAATDAINTLDGAAQREPITPVHTRIADHDGQVYIDCADEENRVIVIGGGCWRVADEEVPVMFRRSSTMLSYPVPDVAGDLDRLWGHLNIDSAEREVVLGWVVAALILENAPHPILCLGGEHGTAKTSAARTIQSLVDPTPLDARSLPADEGAWATSIRSGWVLTFDNLSELGRGVSDGLCKLSTGDAIVRRALYTNDEMSATKAYRALIITTMGLKGVEPDLEDRMVRVELSAIPPEARRPHSEVEAAWARDRPAVVAGLLDLAAKVHHRLPDVATTGGLSRMADFNRVLVAIDEIRGTYGAARYRDSAAQAALDTLSEHPLPNAIVNGRREFESQTAGEIRLAMSLLKKEGGSRGRWPEDAREASDQLRRAAPAMRSLGWTVQDEGRANKAKVKKYTIMPPPHEIDPGGESAGINAAQAGMATGVGGHDGQVLDQQEAGAAGVAGVPGEPSLIACRFCGDGLTVGYVTERGYCTKSECSSARAREHQQTRNESTPTPRDVANMGRRPADRSVV